MITVDSSLCCSVAVYRTLDDDSDVVGFTYAFLAWDSYFAGILPEGVKGVYAVLRNTCNQSITYVLEGNDVR